VKSLTVKQLKKFLNKLSFKFDFVVCLLFGSICQNSFFVHSGVKRALRTIPDTDVQQPSDVRLVKPKGSPA